MVRVLPILTREPDESLGRAPERLRTMIVGTGEHRGMVGLKLQPALGVHVSFVGFRSSDILSPHRRIVCFSML